MRFIIKDGKPYLVSNGKAYPVDIKRSSVKVDGANGTDTAEIGIYTSAEILAKLGECTSIAPKRSRKKENELH